jgi:hypothetical protein
LTENGTDIGEIVTENEATPDIQNIDPLICGENQVTDKSRVLQEILINIPANTDTSIDLPFFVEEVTGIDTELPTSSLDWDFTFSNLFQIASPLVKKKASTATCHRLLTADEMLEQKLKEEEERKRQLDAKESRKQLREMKLKIKKEKLCSKNEKKAVEQFPVVNKKEVKSLQLLNCNGNRKCQDIKTSFKNRLSSELVLCVCVLKYKC